MLARTVAIVTAAALGAAAPAASHYGIGKSAWLGEQTALKRLKTEVVKRYVPGAVQSMKGRCAGVGPRAVRSGATVYKHFSCWLIIRLNAVNFSFDYRVHVTGAAGRITLGGSW